MLLTITDVKRRPEVSQEYSWTETAESLELTQAQIREDVWLEEPFTVKLSIRHGGDRLLLEGHFTMHLRLVCGRCLSEYQAEILFSLDEQLLFARQTASDYADVLDEADKELDVLEGDTIDATSLVHAALLSQLPMTPLCREDCQGLCPVCGVNLNVEQCSCVDDAIDPRMAALAQWLDKKET